MQSIRLRLRQVREVLEPGQRRALMYLAAMSAMASLLEALAVNLIPAFVLVLQNPDAAAALPGASGVLDFLGAPRGQALVIWTGALVLLVFVTKNAIGVALLSLHARLVKRIQVELATRMLQGYLSAPYTEHKARNSSEMVRAILSDLGTMCNAILQSCLMLAAELPVVILLCAVLLLASPAAAFAAMLLGGFSGWLFYSKVRYRVTQLGRENQLQGRFALQYMMESLAGIRETKLYGAEAFACRRTMDRFDLSSQAQFRLTLLNQLPRYFNETVAIVGILLLTLVSLALEDDQSLLPLIALFAVSALRLVPSMNRIVGSLTSLRFGLPALDTVHRELSRMDRASQPQPAATTAAEGPTFERLEVRDLAFGYPGSADFRLQVERFDVRRGERVALVGSSGSGKSTLVDLLTGLLPPDSGRIQWNGGPIDGNLSAWQMRVGYVSQQIHLLDDTIARNVAFAVPEESIDRGRVREALESAQLLEFVLQLPGGLDARIGEAGARLSGGQRQRLGIARALYRRPEFLILDEGTSAMDALTEAQIAATLRELATRMAVLVVAHRLSSIRDFDRVDFMRGGRIIASGSFAQLASAVPEFRDMALKAGLDQEPRAST